MTIADRIAQMRQRIGTHSADELRAMLLTAETRNANRQRARKAQATRKANGTSTPRKRTGKQRGLMGQELEHGRTYRGWAPGPRPTLTPASWIGSGIGRSQPR